MTTFVLPMPPSTNRIWRSGKGKVYRDKNYIQWIAIAGNMVKVARVKQVDPPYRVVYEYGRKDRRRSDLANREKALSDLLQKMGVITDDCEITDMRLRWSDEVEPGMVKITVETAK
jgi:Holliday junction resolvase RusA-like endonuclease